MKTFKKQYNESLKQFSEELWIVLMELLQSDLQSTIAKKLNDHNIHLSDGYKFGFGK